jgi:hypothetical protein
MERVRNVSHIFKRGARTKIYFYERPDDFLASTISTERWKNRFKVAEFKFLEDADIFLATWNPPHGYAVEIVR